MSSELEVLLLATDCESTRAIYHRLLRSHRVIQVVIEQPISRRRLLRRRAEKLGRRVVAGQLLFQLLVQRPLGWASRARLEEIAREHELNLSPVDASHTIHVESVNDEHTIELVRRLRPKVAVLSGTRIVSKATLAAIGAPTLNMHAGITPRYRGVHGGYWALAEGRADLVGTTVHLVDPGIDTGSVLEQVRFAPTARDNFATLPLLHVAHGLPALERQVQRALEGALTPREPLDPTSALRYHPTLFQYLRYGVR